MFVFSGFPYKNSAFQTILGQWELGVREDRGVELESVHLGRNWLRFFFFRGRGRALPSLFWSVHLRSTGKV